MHQSMLQGDTSATDLITVSGDSEVRAAKRQNVRKKRARSRAAQGRGQKLQQHRGANEPDPSLSERIPANVRIHVS